MGCSEKFRGNFELDRLSRPQIVSPQEACTLLAVVAQWWQIQADPDNPVTYENRDRIQVRDLDGLCAPWFDH